MFFAFYYVQEISLILKYEHMNVTIASAPHIFTVRAPPKRHFPFRCFSLYKVQSIRLKKGTLSNHKNTKITENSNHLMIPKIYLVTLWRGLDSVIGLNCLTAAL